MGEFSDSDSGPGRAFGASPAETLLVRELATYVVRKNALLTTESFVASLGGLTWPDDALINTIPCVIDLVGACDLDAMIASTVLAMAALPAA